MKKRGILITTALAACLLGLTSTFVARAADDVTTESITMSPTNKRYALNAGEVKNDEFTIFNQGKEAYTFKVYAKPYSVSGENYNPNFNTSSDMADADKWVTFEKDEYFLKPGDSVKVPYTITVSDDAAPGGHYAALFAETQAEGQANNNIVARQKRVGMLLYATVNGEYRTGGSVISQTGSFFQFAAPLKSNVVIQNTGNADFVAKTHMEVSGIFGSVKYKTDKDYVVLPDTTRKQPFDWEKAPTLGLFKVSLSTNYLDQNKTDVFYVLLAPVWLYLLLMISILAGIMMWVQSKR